MDTKALAKSKRAHSLHHSKKHHNHQAVKAPASSSSAGSGSKNPTGKQTKVKAQPSHGSKNLPSNWDRYGEDSNLEPGDTPQESTSQPSEFVVPKSKGADYAYVISEATAQSQANYSSDGFLSFDDGFEDSTQDFGPLLSAKGQSILSWITDDNFEFEDDTNTSHEAFLSLNLYELAEQLAKAKPSDRLFMEPELLPPELVDDELPPHNEVETCTSAVAELPLHNEVETCTSAVAVESATSSLDSIALDNPASGSLPTFEAANAESELDMLLNSFNETKFLESSSALSSGIPATAAANIGSVKKGTHSGVPASIDDAIDNLLEETSLVIPPTKNPNSNAKLLDDFDSWLDSI